MTNGDSSATIPTTAQTGIKRDGPGGQSATQSAEVYTVDIGKTRVRLIDTPGIGDTRGVDQDNSNMNDILTILRTYNNLHGVLILLKPNAARMTVMSRFCIKQLLTHLHRNATSNIMFGFTNTRGSNYMPGDTFKPLNAFLSEYKEVDIGLLESNVYCFDSESFRYLAAKKQGVDMGHLEDNRRSWEYSVGECERLIEHCRNITPHEVRSTINLNETRTTIYRLTEPMAFIVEKISASIDVNNVAIRELHDFEPTRQELQERLFVQKETLRSEQVEQPRTVCTNDDCIEIRTDIEGKTDIATTTYKTVSKAAIQFGFFLKRHAITPYNDAAVEYLDMLIDQERQKMQRVEVLEKAMKQGDESKLLDDKGVAQLVDSLYALPHFGNDLRNIVKIQESAAESSYRERSCNVSGGLGFHRRRRMNRAQKDEAGNVDHGEGSWAGNTIPAYEPIPGSFPGELDGGTIGGQPGRRVIVVHRPSRTRELWKSFTNLF
ncbi:aaa ATPase domain-containing protein [Fusarium mundagurra]|uniref:Aaa ATPase domain-containing protein n=1 Tax=Fusarium mundagurra TaxID=1567541 RepID=A0A8H6DC87_9HYPO|nr:aaa ATPase domain-containing protein [Fusarium mundagurra]